MTTSDNPRRFVEQQHSCFGVGIEHTPIYRDLVKLWIGLVAKLGKMAIQRYPLLQEELLCMASGAES